VTSPLSGQIAGAAGEPSSVRIGTVTSTSPLTVDVQGTAYTNLGLIGACPAVGATVALLGQSTSAGSDPTSWLVLGEVVNACGGLENLNAFCTANGSTAVAAYADYPGSPSVPFTKARAGSRVLVRWAPTFFVTNTDTGPDFAVRIGGTDYRTHVLTPALTANVRLPSFGERRIPGIPAGVYTVTGRWARVGGTGSVSAAIGADWVNLTVDEVA